MHERTNFVDHILVNMESATKNKEKKALNKAVRVKSSSWNYLSKIKNKLIDEGY